MSDKLRELVAKWRNRAAFREGNYAEATYLCADELEAALAEKPAERPALSENELRRVFKKYGIWYGARYWSFTGDPNTGLLPDLLSLAERPQLSAEQVRDVLQRWLDAFGPKIRAAKKLDYLGDGAKKMRQLYADTAALLTGEAEKVPPPAPTQASGEPQMCWRLLDLGRQIRCTYPLGHEGECGIRPAPAAPPVLQAEPLDKYNVIGCAGGEHCVCQYGWGHKKFAQTPIPVPLASKSKEELVRIVEMMQEDLQWYVDERNKLIAEQPAIRRQAEREAFEKALVNGCYCVCHSGASSRPRCVHCLPEAFKDKADPYCGLTAKGVERLRALADSPVSGGAAKEKP